MAAARARSFFQSSSSSSTFLRSAVTSSASSVAGVARRPPPPPLRLPNRRPSATSPLLHINLRSPVELSFCVESLLPKHSASADALMTSLLSVSCSSYGYLLEGQDETR